jgi:hypothetical protein
MDKCRWAKGAGMDIRHSVPYLSVSSLCMGVLDGSWGGGALKLGKSSLIRLLVVAATRFSLESLVR